MDEYGLMILGMYYILLDNYMKMACIPISTTASHILRRKLPMINSYEGQNVWSSSHW